MQGTYLTDNLQNSDSKEAYMQQEKKLQQIPVWCNCSSHVRAMLL